MKKCIFLFILFLGSQLSSFAQSANLNREYFKVSYVKLPSKPILDNSKRIYSSNTSGIRLSGFTKIAANGTIDLRFDFNGTKVGEVEIVKDKVEEKDKDGNVTSTKYYYSAVTSFSSSGSLSINNSDSEESDSYSYSESDRYSSSTFTSYSAASKYYNTNRYTIRNEFRTKHRKAMESRVYYKINSDYGYVPYTSTNSNNFWILASKKHPETSKHQEVAENLIRIFDEVEYDQPIDAQVESVKKYEDYFNDVVSRYSGDDKKSKKIRYASYYNTALMYLKLDQPEKAKEYAEKLIANDYDKNDGKRIIEGADRLIELLKANATTTRHLEVITEDISDEPVVTEVFVETPEDNSEKSIAFLITIENDTLQTNVTANELSKMSSVANFFNSENEEQQIFEATGVKKMVVANGDIYVVVNFQSSIESDSEPSLKFTKALVEGAKFSLYEHMGSEFVLLLNGSEKGVSTMGKDFVFGFNKELASFCESCPALKTRVEAGEFKNTQESLIAFSNALNTCE
ncbi:hypothetical protein H0I23_10285 [Cellulophaga sp. HaHaR_3_176]|uniref:hypothetical protein n=1 Tax=Cellulophaga sp. HaHaR_3_176 TaxID=1942464 RepID=UPI001C1FDED8|nr:hypothetical protein [Cellulophaga sp. HaHaR_3_176]QWX82851.1 hypothetical protein H0I23_10285 [Cellulophaga sp. HaHaR_3_176]